MSQSISPEVVKGFLEEAAQCLPGIRHGISTYLTETNPSPSEELAESYRLTHNLKGASSLVGLTEISQRARAIENVLEALVSGPRSPDVPTTDVDTAIQLLSELDEIEQALQLLDPSGDLEQHGPEVALSETPAPAQPVSNEDSLVDPELLEVYTMEAEDHLRTITAGLSQLEKTPTDREVLQEVRRSVHTLKGAAAVVGLRVIAKLAHRMEDLLDVLYEDAHPLTPEALSALLTGTEILENLGTTSPESLHGAIDELFERLSPLIPPRKPRSPEPEPFETDAELTAALDAVVPEPAAPVAAPSASPISSLVKVIRVPLPRLDALVRLVGELVINRSVLEQRVRDLEKQVEELQRSSGRLKNVTYKLEGGYEAAALGGLGTPTGAGAAAANFERIREQAARPLHRVYSDMPSTSGTGHGFDELEMDRYTAFHQLTRELNEATTDAGAVAAEMDGFVGDFDSILTQQRSLTNEIQDGLMKVRMLPLRVLTTRLHRTVRVTADQERKKAEFVVQGANVEMDTTVIEQIVDPLLHLLRNAVSHGIEFPEERLRLGKPEQGLVSLRAFHENTDVVLQVSDDGRGLDPEAVRRKAVQLGYATPNGAAALTDRELHRLIFTPGFSTANAVSEVSGRGVGLDAVQDMVRRLRGTLSLESTPGAGMTFILRLPMTLTVTRSLLVETYGHTLAVPLNNVTQILRIEHEEIEKLGETEVLRHAGRTYPLHYLRKALHFAETDRRDLRHAVLLVRLPLGESAIVVDRVLEGREIVIKPLGSHLRYVRGVMGATLLGDGRLVPILNLADLLSDPAEVHAASRATEGAASARAATIMIVDDSPSIRRVNANLIKSEGWTAVTAKDGLDALEQLHHMTEVPRAILLDVEMPRMDGYELLATLKSEEAYQDVPVIMITSRSGEKHRKKAMDLGAAEYVTKPYQNQALLHRLRHWVN